MDTYVLIRIQEGKNDTQKSEEISVVLKCWIFSIEGWGFLLYLGRPSLQFLIPTCKILQFLIIKSLDPDSKLSQDPH
jgi:hypothetical protein